MLEVKQKEIRLAKAIDITSWTEEQIKQLPRLKEIAVSFGIYGMNGMLLSDSERNHYKIVGRTTNLFRF